MHERNTSLCFPRWFQSINTFLLRVAILYFVLQFAFIRTHIASLKGEDSQVSVKDEMMMMVPVQSDQNKNDGGDVQQEKTIKKNAFSDVANEKSPEIDMFSLDYASSGRKMSMEQFFNIHIKQLRSKRLLERNKTKFCISTSFLYSKHKMPEVLCAPSYSVIGFPKTGSSSVWNYMGQHPKIKVYFKKEAHYFHRQPSEIFNAKAWFSYLRGYQRVTGNEIRSGVIFGDHTPGYIWRIPWKCRSGTGRFGCASNNREFPVNYTAVMMQRFIPRATLVILTRDPVERAYSHFYHFMDPKSCQNNKRNPDCFHKHVIEVLGSFQSCIVSNGKWHPICAWGPIGGELAWKQHLRSFNLGLYSVFIGLWLKFYEKRQFCVIDLEHLKAGLTIGLGMIEDCLGLTHLPSYEATKINRRGTVKHVEPMLNGTKALLQESYEPYNQRLCAMQLYPLKCNTSWLSKYEHQGGFHLEIQRELEEQ